MLARILARLLAPFAVRCGRATHYAHSTADALAWAACYPAGFGTVVVINRRTGRVVAVRSTSEV